MSAPVEPMTDAPAEAAPAATPFTMVTGDPAAMVCTDDVCYIPETQPPA